MTLLETLIQRRSIRQYLPTEVEQQKIDAIIQGTLTAPSSKNCRSTRIAVIKDRTTLLRLSTMRSSGSTFIKDAPIAFAIMADDSSSDMWRENCAISATILQLMAESLGLASCWVQVFGRPHDNDAPQGKTTQEYIHEIMEATKPYKIMCIITVGYPQSRPHPHSGLANEDKVIEI